MVIDPKVFIPNLVKLRGEESIDQILLGLHQLFSAISEMNAEQVVSTFQTIQLTAELGGFQENLEIRALKNACRNRMVAILLNNEGSTEYNMGRYFAQILDTEKSYRYPPDLRLF